MEGAVLFSSNYFFKIHSIFLPLLFKTKNQRHQHRTPGTTRKRTKEKQEPREQLRTNHRTAPCDLRDCSFSTAGRVPIPALPKQQGTHVEDNNSKRTLFLADFLPSHCESFCSFGVSSSFPFSCTVSNPTNVTLLPCPKVREGR